MPYVGSYWRSCSRTSIIRSSLSFPHKSNGLGLTVQLGCKQRDLCYGCNCGTNGWVNCYQLYCRPTFLEPIKLKLSCGLSSDENRCSAGNLRVNDEMFKEHIYQRFVRHMQCFGDKMRCREQIDLCNKSTQTFLCVFAGNL